MKELLIILGILTVFSTSYFLTIGRKKADEIIKYFTPIYIKYKGDQQQLLELINTHRIEIGLQKVIPCKSLNDAAKKHCEYMFEMLEANHHGALKRRKYFITMGFVDYSEIVAEKYTSNKTMFRAYLRSNTHRQAIETTEFNCVGMFSLRDEDEIYNITIFTQY